MTFRAARSAAGVAALAALVLGAPGCAVDEAEEVAQYRRVLDAGITTTPAPPAAGKRLDLATAMRLANARDEALAAVGEDYVRSLIERRRAVASFLPTIMLSPRAFARDRVRPDDDTRGVDVPATFEMDVSPVTDLAELDRTDLDAERRRALLLAAQDDLLLDVGRTHFAVLLAERRSEVLRSSIALQEARVEDARARTEAGLQPPLDVALAESRAADARGDLVDSERVARNGRTLLSFLTGWRVGDTPLDGTLALTTEPAPAEDLVRDAIRLRPEVLAAITAVPVAEADLRAAYGGYWPSVTIDVEAFLSQDSEPTDLDWAALLEVHIPLFQAGLVEADVREALSRLREAKLLAARAERSVRLDVETAREGYVSVGRRLHELAVRLEASRRALDLADGQWKAGIGTNLERLTAQDDLLAVELDVATAELEKRIRRLELERACGRLHEIAGLRRELRTPPGGEEAQRAASR